MTSFSPYSITDEFALRANEMVTLTPGLGPPGLGLLASQSSRMLRWQYIISHPTFSTYKKSRNFNLHKRQFSEQALEELESLRNLTTAKK